MEEKEIESARLRPYIVRHRKLFIGIGLFILAVLIIVFVLGRLDAKRQEAGRQDSVLNLFSSEPKRVPYEELKATEDIQILTHFPADFTEFFSDADILLAQANEDNDSVVIDEPFFWFHNPLNKGMGGRRWEFTNPHVPAVWHDRAGFQIETYPSYTMADVTVRKEDIRGGRPRDEDGTVLDAMPLDQVNPEDLWLDEINGDPVYMELSLTFHVNDYVHYEVGGKSWIRKAIVDEIVEKGTVHLPAGTHFGYGEGSISLHDDRVDAGPYPGNVNIFDYMTNELQQELLALYEPYYEYHKSQGVYPFSDPTASYMWWDEPGIIEGVWMNADLPTLADADEAHLWQFQFIGIVGLDYINTETYWRILEHPWNIENNLIGVFIENDLPERLYLLEGDKTSGVLMAMDPEPGHDNPNGWNPLLPDSDTNHPSRGNRSYFRFEIQAHEDMWQDRLTIDRFDSEEAAKAGFTDSAITYYRGFDPRDAEL